MNNKIYLNIENNIGIITINNPPVNALSIDLIEEINQSINSIKDVKVVIFKSSGKGFCAGADLKERSSMDDNQTIKIVERYREVFNNIQEIACPTIANIHGYALGGGLELALACDFRFATSDSILGFPETKKCDGLDRKLCPESRSEKPRTRRPVKERK